jgi:hypothetical protein
MVGQIRSWRATGFYDVQRVRGTVTPLRAAAGPESL